MYREYDKGIYVIEHQLADLWVAKNIKQENVDYYYGGTRTVPYNIDEEQTFEIIKYLENYESGLKNTLINKAIHNHVFDEYSNILPEGFIGSTVGGGRCVIHPKSQEVESIIMDTNHKRHSEVIEQLFAALGKFLNEQNGIVKLTPDFGRFAGLADMLHVHTENVLGIACDKGGCGGKASYTSTGIIEAIKALGFENKKDVPVTLIGSNGACGIGVLEYLIEENYTDIAICDLSYEEENNRTTLDYYIEKGCKHLTSQKGIFTEECFNRGGLIIATTVGNEFIHSNTDVLKDETVFLLAHNEAIPVGKEGLEFIDQILNKKNILIVPGQLLTFGGALTSRIEWFFRQNKKGMYFDKQLAHNMVKVATRYWINEMCKENSKINIFRCLYETCLPLECR